MSFAKHPSDWNQLDSLDLGECINCLKKRAEELRSSWGSRWMLERQIVKRVVRVGWPSSDNTVWLAWPRKPSNREAC